MTDWRCEWVGSYINRFRHLNMMELNMSRTLWSAVWGPEWFTELCEKQSKLSFLCRSSGINATAHSRHLIKFMTYVNEQPSSGRRFKINISSQIPASVFTPLRSRLGATWHILENMWWYFFNYLQCLGRRGGTPVENTPLCVSWHSQIYHSPPISIHHHLHHLSSEGPRGSCCQSQLTGQMGGGGGTTGLTCRQTTTHINIYTSNLEN